MKPFKITALNLTLGGAIALASIAITTPSLLAQTVQTVEGITVTGHMTYENEPEALSYRVGYADIDLRTDAGMDELNRRVRKTAEYLCERIGETNHSMSAAPSCRDAAISQVAPAVREAKLNALRTPNWKPGPAWTPPSTQR
jgi:UrcA family protein